MRRNIICIVGRMNVGKSTLFNRLTRSRKAIVDNTPGVTRDRNESHIKYRDMELTLVDTGGIDLELDGDTEVSVKKQAQLAIQTSDLIFFMVDVRSGILGGDIDIAQFLRKANKPVVLVVNKVDTSKQSNDVYNFLKLGFGMPVSIAAEHAIGIEDLMEAAIQSLSNTLSDDERSEEERIDITNVAIVGRPNVGKSSLINGILGEDRHIVTNIPGTTRDSTDSIYKYNGKYYRLIDTAGLRKIGKTKNKIDKIAAIKAKESIARCQIAVLLFDANEGITAQDAKVGGYITEEGRGCIIAANKWDLTPRTEDYLKLLRHNAERKISFLLWAPMITMSTLSRHNMFRIFKYIDRVRDNMQQTVSTAQLNKFLQQVQKHHSPPRRREGLPVKFYYTTQISNQPPTFLIFTNTKGKIHFSYRRFMINSLRKEFNFEGCPIRLVFKHKRE